MAGKVQVTIDIADIFRALRLNNIGQPSDCSNVLIGIIEHHVRAKENEPTLDLEKEGHIGLNEGLPRI